MTAGTRKLTVSSSYLAGVKVTAGQSKNVRPRHGRRSAEAIARRKEAASIGRQIRRLIALVLGA
jgi:hypothetical protein